VQNRTLLGVTLGAECWRCTVGAGWVHLLRVREEAYTPLYSTAGYPGGIPALLLFLP